MRFVVKDQKWQVIQATGFIHPTGTCNNNVQLVFMTRVILMIFVYTYFLNWNVLPLSLGLPWKIGLESQ